MIDKSSKEELQRLLDLFPRDALKLEWPSAEGKKDDMCTEAAATATTKEILEFVDRNFSKCKHRNCMQL